MQKLKKLENVIHILREKMMNKLLDIDKEDKLIDKMIKPYLFCIKILSILLLLSIICNIYLSTKTVNIKLVANKNTESNINQES